MLRLRHVAAAALAAVILSPFTAQAQGTVADYRRAMELRERVQRLPVNVPEPAVWVDEGTAFWYRKSVAGGNEFVLVDAATLAKRAPFDHQRLATALNTALKPAKPYTAVTLPFTAFSLDESQGTLQFNLDAAVWRCQLATYTCADDSARGRRSGGGGGRGGGLAGLGRGGVRHQRRRAAQVAGRQARSDVINNYNVASPRDGAESAHAADHRRLRRRLLRPAIARLVAGLEAPRGLPRQARLPARGALRRIVARRSAPAEAHARCIYTKPGDVLDVEQPVLFDVAAQAHDRGRRRALPECLRQIARSVWRKDSRAFTFEYNQRGHQVYRVIEVDAATGAARAVVVRRADDVLLTTRGEEAIASTSRTAAR